MSRYGYRGYDEGGYGFRPYVSVAQRRAKAARHLKSMSKRGHVAEPITIAGSKITTTFWGKAWCDHLESFSDYENRLPRGRSYVRNGSVVDLKIKPGQITAIVSGSDLYSIKINIDPLKPQNWKDVQSRCAGRIGSLVELLQGKLSNDVMQVVTDRKSGLFPQSGEIKLGCSCPDSATMCKHVAAVLYGVGARLDHQPELLFLLRKVDHSELIASVGDLAQANQPKSRGTKKTIAAENLADVFGIEMESAEPPTESKSKPSETKAQPTKRVKSKITAKSPASMKPRTVVKNASQKISSPIVPAHATGKTSKKLKRTTDPAETVPPPPKATVVAAIKKRITKKSATRNVKPKSK